MKGRHATPACAHQAAEVAARSQEAPIAGANHVNISFTHRLAEKMQTQTRATYATKIAGEKLQ